MPQSPFPDESNKIFVHGGEYVAVPNSAILSTTLGSCVAVCLYDRLNGIMGMNHIILSNKKYFRKVECSPANAKYGHCAMKLLLDKMLSIGARLENMEAKAFGGSTLFWTNRPCKGEFCVGEINGAFVKDYIRETGIPLVEEDLGGPSGRFISFFPESFNVEVRMLGKNSTKKLFKQENGVTRQAMG